MLFTGIVQGFRVPNPAIPGAHIALIATNNNRVQTPINSLDKMHVCLQKQFELNQRILRNEEEASAINADLDDFLQDMQMDAPLFACVNAGGMMRGTQPVWGQLWTEENRQMSATCLPEEGLGNSREELALSAIVDVLSWRHAPEPSATWPTCCCLS
jgi:hypothetical protein